MKHVPIVVLDFGSQYTQIIARKLRESGVYSEIVPYNESIEDIMARTPKGIILSGGPASVYANDSYHPDSTIFDLGLPILGICYGMQLIAQHFGGSVIPATSHEYGKAKLKFEIENPIFKDTTDGQIVWMSHGDRVENIPAGFEKIAISENSPYAAIADTNRNIYAFQFHPEVYHSECGSKLLKNFAKYICGCESTWNMGSFAKEQIERVKKQVGNKKVLCAVSGGVDSSVVATLLFEAIGNQVIPVFVDNGLLRANEREQVQAMFASRGVKLITVDASEEFLTKLEGITDPERKRKIIGETFIEVFDKEAKKHDGIEFLAQGTLYTDVIESVSVKGPSKTIKSHHNVGGLPDWMKFELIFVDSYIDISKVADVGKVFLIKNAQTINQDFVKETFNKTLFLRTKNKDAKGWILDVMNCVDLIKKETFTLDEIYKFEQKLKIKYPNNNFIKDKIRQQLQLLRDKGIIEFVGRGNYKKVIYGNI